MNEVSKYNVYGNSIFYIDINNGCIINTLSPKNYFEAKKDKLLSIALMSSILITNNTIFVLAERVLKNNRITKISTKKICDYLLKRANNTKEQHVFYLGNTLKSLKLFEQKIKNSYPKIKVSGYVPTFSIENSIKNKKVIAAINKNKPDVLFINLGIPKQEKWLYKNKFNIQVKVIVLIEDETILSTPTSINNLKTLFEKKLKNFNDKLKKPHLILKSNFCLSFLLMLDVLKEYFFKKTPIN